MKCKDAVPSVTQSLPMQDTFDIVHQPTDPVFLPFFSWISVMEKIFQIVSTKWATLSIPNYKTFWFFSIHCFYYVSRHSVYLEKPKRLIIWNGGSNTFSQKEKNKTKYHFRLKLQGTFRFVRTRFWPTITHLCDIKP
jgi:hypothetical protein